MGKFNFKKIFYLLIGICVICFTLVCEILKIYLISYKVFTERTKVAVVRCVKENNNKYLNIFFQAGDLKGRSEKYLFSADELVVEARIVKWYNFLGLLGVQNYYRLERISSRYFNIQDEKTKPRFVYGIYKGTDIVWWLVYKYQRFIPGVDAVYGNSAFVPFEEGKIFEVYITRTGVMINDISVPKNRDWLSVG